MGARPPNVPFWLRSARCEVELADGALRWAVFNSALDADAGDGVILGSSSLEQIVANAASIEGGPLPLEVGAGPGHTRL